MFDFGIIWFGNDHQRSQCHANALQNFVAVNQLVAIFERYWFQVLAAIILVASLSLTGDAQEPGYECLNKRLWVHLPNQSYLLQMAAN